MSRILRRILDVRIILAVQLPSDESPDKLCTRDNKAGAIFNLTKGTGHHHAWIFIYTQPAGTLERRGVCKPRHGGRFSESTFSREVFLRLSIARPQKVKPLFSYYFLLLQGGN